MDFYNRLNYSLGNEDWQVEEQALRILPGDRVVCVTASGDRPLHLLMTDCAEIISIDMNRIQTFLLELKIAAISNLAYEKYLSFLGCTFTNHRYAIFKELKLHLSYDAAHYWEQHKKMIISGIIYQGRVERLTHFFAKFINLLRHKEIDTLLTFKDMDLQRNYVANKWDTAWWRKFFDIFLNPNLIKHILNDPGLIAFVDPSIKPGNYIYQRMLKYLNTHLAKKSALIQLLLTGKVLPEAYLPYLTYDGYYKIRRDINRLKFKTSNIIEYINGTEHNEFHCFSMSDIASYMSQGNFERLLLGIRNAAKPNARFCLRKLMSNHYIPTDLTANFQRDAKLEHKLENEESNFVYRFFVGEVQK